MDDVLVGLLLVMVGGAFALSGYLAMRVIIPIWGAMAGFLAGAGLVANITDGGFLGTLVGWLVALGLGAVFGLLAYLYFEVSVFLAMAAIGFSLGTGLMVAMGIRWSWLVVLGGVAAGLALGWFAVVTDLPMVLLVVLTALGGAAVAVAGLMLVFGTVDLDQLGAASTTERIDDGWWWYALFVAIAAFGIGGQFRRPDGIRGSLRDTWQESGGRQLRRRD